MSVPVRGFDDSSQAVPAEDELRSGLELDCSPVFDFDDSLEPDLLDSADELEVFDEPDDPDLADPDEPVDVVIVGAFCAFVACPFVVCPFVVCPFVVCPFVTVADFTTRALATVVAARAAAGVAARGTGLLVVVTPPVASRPGTVSWLLLKPATWPLPPAGTGTNGPTAVCERPTTTIPMYAAHKVVTPIPTIRAHRPRRPESSTNTCVGIGATAPLITRLNTLPRFAVNHLRSCSGVWPRLPGSRAMVESAPDYPPVSCGKA
ncbi:MAG TPA: hypothetical protein VNA11_12310 [Pseudonocardia sp.]|nr:hypothetical protein [Pseudonocardia sp.]